MRIYIGSKSAPAISQIEDRIKKQEVLAKLYDAYETFGYLEVLLTDESLSNANLRNTINTLYEIRKIGKLHGFYDMRIGLEGPLYIPNIKDKYGNKVPCDPWRGGLEDRKNMELREKSLELGEEIAKIADNLEADFVNMHVGDLRSVQELKSLDEKEWAEQKYGALDTIKEIGKRMKTIIRNNKTTVTFENTPAYRVIRYYHPLHGQQKRAESLIGRFYWDFKKLVNSLECEICFDVSHAGLSHNAQRKVVLNETLKNQKKAREVFPGIMIDTCVAKNVKPEKLSKKHLTYYSQFIEELGDKFKVIHMSDYKGIRGEGMRIGSGEMDVNLVIKKILRKIQKPIFITVEVDLPKEQYENATFMMEGIEIVYNVLKEFL